MQQRCAAVTAAAAEVAAAPFWPALSQLLRALPPHCAPAALQRMVVYGLGSLEQPGAVHIRYQLALATLLAGGSGGGGRSGQASLLASLLAPPEAFDPVFTPLDRAVLAALNVQVRWVGATRERARRCGRPVRSVGAARQCSQVQPADPIRRNPQLLSHHRPGCSQVLVRDEGGRRVAAQPTLFWMPHCEAALTDALLAANLAAGTLHNVVILGNRFSGYAASWALRHRAQAPPGGRLERPDAMLRLCEAGAACEAAVAEAGFPVASAFNDLGLHWFPLDWRQRLEAGGRPSGQPGVS